MTKKNKKSDLKLVHGSSDKYLTDWRERIDAATLAPMTRVRPKRALLTSASSTRRASARCDSRATS
jgi:hypothetical protein